MARADQPPGRLDAVSYQYVAARPLRGRNLTLKVGQPFPVQDIRWIRALGPSFGVPDAKRRDLADLDYVRLVCHVIRYDPQTGMWE